MTRRERRTTKRRTRRIGIAVASLAMLGASLGLSGVASANGRPGHYYQCEPGPNTYGYYYSGSTNYSQGNAYNACGL